MPRELLIPKNSLEYIFRSIRDLQKRMDRMTGNPRPSAPVYADDEVPEEIHDGEYWISSTDGQFYWQANGNTHHT